MSEEIYTKFDSNFSNLSNDIKYIELKINDVQDKIVELKLQLQNILGIIATVQGADKAKTYGVYNELMKLLSAFYSNLAVLIDLRQKYRGQEGDLKYKSVKLIELEMKKINDDDAPPSNDDVLKSIQNFDMNSLFKDDEKYKL
ncbi:MAG: hypothetical protein IPH62_19530 [Ignavibacteriae bacterium]|nr:hypothetical protein [Ignavibacteriota bacterium]